MIKSIGNPTDIPLKSQRNSKEPPWKSHRNHTGIQYHRNPKGISWKSQRTPIEIS